MKFFNMFRQPYLDGDDGVNLGGGGTPTDTTGQQTTTQTTDTTQTGIGQQQTQQEQMFKLKYNHEEREIPYSQAVELAQKGMNYDKGIERARQEAAQQARDAWVAEQGYVWKGKQITTEAEYKEALREKQLIDEGYDPKKISEIVSKHPDVQKAQQFMKNFESRQSQEKEYTDFIDWHTKTYGKEPEPNSIPVEVWKAVKEGVPLKVAYIEHAFSGYRSKEIEAEKLAQTQQANEKNANNSTGSVRTSGNTGQGYISKEDYEANKHDHNWMSKNYDNLISSMNKWGK